MVSQQLRDVSALIRAGRTQERPGSIEEMRAGFERMMTMFPPPDGVRFEAVSAGGVPAEWCRPAGETRGTVYYLHGGGYVMGSPLTHRRLLASLCLAAGTAALSLDYRLAPEHPHPAALADALAGYRWLLADGGARPDEVVIAGDSAGGGLSLACLVALRDAGEALPAGGFLMSPWTDLLATGESHTSRAELDVMLGGAETDETVGWYAGGRDPGEPLISPLYAELAGLPPLLVQVGDAEVLLDDATRLVERARAAGVDAACDVWPEAFHVFQGAVGAIPEADAAIGQAGAWIRERIG